MPRPRRGEDLLRAAAARFYRDGITATGVDTLAADAGTAKMTLYTNFGSKDELVVAYLRERDRRFQGELDAELAARSDPRERALAIVDLYGRHLDDEGFRGCAFVNAAAELPDGHPGREVVAAHKQRVLDRWRTLAAEFGAPDPDRLARECHYLLEGAFVQTGVGLDPDRLAVARALIRDAFDRAAAGA